MTTQRLPVTPSQTVGPFFHPSLAHVDVPQNHVARADTRGARIRIEGVVFDGAGDPVPDAIVEIWQANSEGRYAHPGDTRDLAVDGGFIGFARSATDDAGRFWFETVKPGRVPFDTEGSRMQAPHISVTIFARGLLNHLFTRIYFADDLANADDPILAFVPAERRETLLAIRGDGDSAIYRFDIRLQGEGETVFFNPMGNGMR
jgi:protocatechuate 3,4-dioxygenase alpha subunit